MTMKDDNKAADGLTIGDNRQWVGCGFVLEGSVDLGSQDGSPYFMSPIRINLRANNPLADLDEVIRVLTANRTRIAAVLKQMLADPDMTVRLRRLDYATKSAERDAAYPARKAQSDVAKPPPKPAAPRPPPKPQPAAAKAAEPQPKSVARSILSPPKPGGIRGMF